MWFYMAPHRRLQRPVWIMLGQVGASEFRITMDCGTLMALRRNEISRFMANNKCGLAHFVQFYMDYVNL